MKKLVLITALALLATAPYTLAQCNASKRTASKNHHKQGTDIVSTALAAGQFKTLAQALGSAGLVKALQGKGPFTVFAPTDEAFAKLPAGVVESLLKPENKERLTEILTYHVSKGRLDAGAVTRRSGTTTLNGQRLAFDTSSGVVVGNANVVTADIACSNGIIHVIDTVLIPTEDSIVEVAANNGSFSTLLAAAKAANLDELLTHQGPFTVFAPTDEAFAKIPKQTLDSLLQPQNRDKLAEILQLHVVKGRVYADDAVSAGATHAVSGGDLNFRLDNGRLKVNGAGIVATDVQAENGVIHVIDNVLLPE